MVKYEPDDIVTTKDGKRHRVLWQTKRAPDGSAARLHVKCAEGKPGKGYNIDTDRIIHHETHKRPQMEKVVK